MNSFSYVLNQKQQFNFFMMFQNTIILEIKKATTKTGTKTWLAKVVAILIYITRLR